MTDFIDHLSRQESVSKQNEKCFQIRHNLTRIRPNYFTIRSIILSLQVSEKKHLFFLLHHHNCRFYNNRSPVLGYSMSAVRHMIRSHWLLFLEGRTTSWCILRFDWLGQLSFCTLFYFWNIYIFFIGIQYSRLQYVMDLWEFALGSEYL